MTVERDWLKRNHEALFNQANQTRNFLDIKANRDRIGLAEGTVIGAWYDTFFVPKHETFKAVFADWLNPAERTKVKISKLEEAEVELKEVYRQLYNGFLKENPLVSDDDLIAMGLPKRSAGRKPSSVAGKAPGHRVDSSVLGMIILHFFNIDTGHGKPDGQHGVEIVALVAGAGDPEPVKWEELTLSYFDTRSPFSLSFENNQRGKKFFFALRWENTRGEKGPWSEIAYAIIP